MFKYVILWITLITISALASARSQPANVEFPLITTKAEVLKGIENSAWDPFDPRECANAHGYYCGVDIFVKTGTPVVSATAGRVIFVENNAANDQFGARLQIKASSGDIYYYAHLLSGSITVNNGDVVRAGDQLGKVGTSADAEGTVSHLHVDITPAPARQRPECAGEACKHYDWGDIKQLLEQAYNQLPSEQNH